MRFQMSSEEIEEAYQEWILALEMDVDIEILEENLKEEILWLLCA